MKKEDCILFSGGAQGAEAEFGANAENSGIEEVNFTFEGHTIVRHRGLRVLTRKILQTIWYQINSGQEVFIVGEILADKTVKGGTGWGAEFSKICNKPLHVFDQKKGAWFSWNKLDWVERKKGDEPVITHMHFAGGGTRFLEENGKKAIQDLFERSLG
jgi:hypothetical protein